jgi:cob(I)alamin adenosyltransferase
MVRLDRIYTGGGDTGQTSLGDGARVAKHDIRVAAFGDVDEANAAIGIARSAAETTGNSHIADLLGAIQNDLFDLGADLCVPTDRPGKTTLRMSETQVTRLETAIDAATADLQPLKSFVLPGGTALAAHLHLARTIARRAERAMTGLAATDTVNPQALKYVNRLSDLLFVLARQANDQGRTDVLWRPGDGA